MDYDDYLYSTRESYEEYCRSDFNRRIEAKVDEAIERVSYVVDEDHAKAFLKILSFASGNRCEEAEAMCKDLGLNYSHFSALDDLEYQEQNDRIECQERQFDEFAM